MNLDKAIERLQARVDGEFPANDPENIDDMKLSIEALKWRQLMELDYGSWCGPPLPGETED